MLGNSLLLPQSLLRLRQQSGSSLPGTRVVRALAKMGEAVLQVVALVGSSGQAKVGARVAGIARQDVLELIRGLRGAPLTEQHFSQSQPRRIGYIRAQIGGALEFRDGRVRVAQRECDPLIIGPAGFPAVEAFSLGQATVGFV